MEDKKYRVEFYNPNKDYKSIAETLKQLDDTGDLMSDEKVLDAIENFKNKDNLLKYPNLDKVSEPTFSSDLDKFNIDCLTFINYVKQCKQTDEFFVLYLSRVGNVIKCGKYDHGTQIDLDKIKMVSDNDLKKIYDLLQNEFPNDFVDGCKHTFGQGWTLNPSIGENIWIDIKSDNLNDQNWFYEESHKEPSNEIQNKR